MLTVPDESQDPLATEPNEGPIVPNCSDAQPEPSATDSSNPTSDDPICSAAEASAQPPKPHDLISADAEQAKQQAETPVNSDCSAQPAEENASKPEAKPIASAESGQGADVPRSSEAEALMSRHVPLLRATRSRADFYEEKAGELWGCAAYVVECSYKTIATCVRAMGFVWTKEVRATAHH